MFLTGWLGFYRWLPSDNALCQKGYELCICKPKLLAEHSLGMLAEKRRSGYLYV